MKDLEVKWAPVNETSLMFYLANEVDVELAPRIGQVAAFIKSEHSDVCEVRRYSLGS